MKISGIHYDFQFNFQFYFLNLAFRFQSFQVEEVDAGVAMRWFRKGARLDVAAAQNVVVRCTPGLREVELFGDLSRVVAGAIYLGVLEFVFSSDFQRFLDHLDAHALAVVSVSDRQNGDVEDLFTTQLLVQLRFPADYRCDFQKLLSLVGFSFGCHFRKICTVEFATSLVHRDSYD